MSNTLAYHGKVCIWQPKILMLLNTVQDSRGSFEGLVSWKKIEKDIPWGVIILFGGGFALAEGCEKSGTIVAF